MTDVSTIRRAFAARIKASPPATAEAKCAAAALAASLRNLEKNNTPLLRTFVAADAARFETATRGDGR